ncbi:hypothetical protein [Modestobacter versicolor]|uniref:Uncharacterized protein n=1 Tax=Modestobacter versicolor TaxID=429133 RepID=A0A323V967_9ACTN|nr:hypothetical protein [Modestobacter versicolor]MBB3676825.1 hypothetical protein [Modestobacter versicolor]PZA20543.1 hypothetical protein DMO24_14940 [Modestobacter versicolor]
MTQTRPAPAARNPALVRAAQVGAVASVLALLWQFATAGQLLSQEDAMGGHATGAVVLHVANAVLLVATVLHVRAGGARWPAVLAAAVFAAGFVQAAIGDAGNMGAHVPGALVLSVGTVWLTAWAFRRHPVA